MDNDSSIDTGFKYRNAPDRVASARIDADDAAIPCGGVEDAFATKPSEVRMGIRIVSGTIARRRRPNEFTTFFLESVKAVRRWTLRSPVRSDTARDYEVMNDQRRSGAAVGKSKPAKFLHQRMVPERFAIGIESSKDALRPLHEDIAGFGINCRAGSGVALIHSVAKEIVVEMLPKFFASLGIETGNALLHIGALSQVT